MHIDHSKLVELLVETSGLDKEKVESQLKELIDEIKAAIQEGDAYEVDGFGVFSGIGNNVIFIPADELSTEINYKYVGMEPIEIDDATSPEEDLPEESESAPSETDLDDEDPFAGLLDDVAETDEPRPDSSFELDMDEETEEDASDEETSQEGDAPFDLDDEKESESDPEEEKPGPDKWGIDTYKDDTAETMFSGLLGKQETSEEAEDESQEKDHFKALFEQEGEDESSDSLLNEFTEAGDNDSDDTEEALRMELETQSSDSDNEEDFDDPFETLAAENDDDDDDTFTDVEENASSKEKPKKQEEVIPVIKNLSSEGAKKKRKEEQKEEKEDTFDLKKDKTKVKTPSDSKSQPVMLWVLLIILILGGGTYALGYFGVVNIPGVTPKPQMASTNSQTTPPATQPETTPQDQQQEPQNQAPADQPQQEPQQGIPAEEPAQDQEQESSSQVSTDREVPANQSTYGMNGVPVSAANDGYTIVIYSLSKESNAEARRNELSEEGYRVLVVRVPSQQYGTLYRVSLGQFRTTRDAAIAAEKLKPPFSENYFITKIQ